MNTSIQKKEAFTLVEIIVVVGIISLLVSLVVPQMLRSRMNANEVASIAAMRNINNACQVYYNNISPHSYPPNGLTDLALPTTNPPYIDVRLASATTVATAKQGYYYEYTFTDEESFTLIAWPSRFGRTGARNFFVNELGVITYNNQEGVAPTIDDLKVQ